MQHASAPTVETRHRQPCTHSPATVGTGPKRPKEYSVTVSSIDKLEAHLATLPDPLTQGVKGLGAVRHTDGRVTLTLLTPPNNLSFSPFKRSGAVQVTGRLRQGDADCGNFGFNQIETPPLSDFPSR